MVRCISCRNLKRKTDTIHLYSAPYYCARKLRFRYDFDDEPVTDGSCPGYTSTLSRRDKRRMQSYRSRVLKG